MHVLDRFRLDSKVVLVTGASSGLGVAIAQACAEAGADIVLAARRAEKLAATAALVTAAGGAAFTVTTDISDPQQVQDMVDAAMAHYGHIDILVNNAGISSVAAATRETPKDFRDVVETNLHGSFWAAQACARVMRPGSSIINVASTSAFTTSPLPQAAYSASKAAIVGLTRELASQWGRRKGIRVNAVAPGAFRTEMTETGLSGHEDMILPRIVLDRIGDPEELAATVVWLASDAAGYVTGQTIVVDGGFTIT